VYYTLLKFLGWGLLLAVIGGCVGWALRALKGRGELARARQTAGTSDEVEELRRQLADFEQVVAERDRLRMQVADMRHADSPGVVGSAVAAASASGGEPADPRDEPAAGETTGSEMPGGEAAGSEEAGSEGMELDGPTEPLDLEASAAVLGRQIELDDLTVIDGIGPKIAELCAGIGITTWSKLAESDVAVLQSMLDDAGSRYRVHDPASWPRQAGLLAAGRWGEFAALTDDASDGR